MDQPSQPLLGIIDDRQPRLQGTIQENEWGGLIDGRQVIVAAGSDAVGPPDYKDPSTNGFLVVDIVTDAVTGATQEHTYRYGSVPGPFKIVAVDGDRLTVAGGNGATFHFDAATDTMTP